MSAPFHHSTRTRAFWRELVRRAAPLVPTPFYVFSASPIRAALAQLRVVERTVPLPVRHWLSCKTQPLRPLLQWWHRQGGAIEVVSEFELQAALAEKFAPERILINGPAKHAWLPRHLVPGLSVNFDSLNELRALLPFALRLHWQLGLRLLTGEEHDPEHPGCSPPFGLDPTAAAQALATLRRIGIEPPIVHLHLRTNVASAAVYRRALNEVVRFCHDNCWNPACLDCGGGLPPPHTRGPDSRAFDARMNLPAYAAACRDAVARLPRLRELWLENGRFVTARSGALVLCVLDVKERRGERQLICDGGRTLHALVSHWEDHELLVWPPRRGPARPTAVHGPTCMAFDRLARRPLPASVRPGDRLIWMEAGAYHLPWETRFSHGHAAVVWHEGRQLKPVRRPQSFHDWWSPWI